MRLEGEHLFAVPRERLWAALLDPTLLANVLPGCEPLESAGENSYRAAMTVAVGPVKGRFQGTLVLSDLVPPAGYTIRIDGSGPSGFLRGAGAIELAEAAGGARLVYRVDTQVGGRIASVGQRLIESSARAIAKQGLEGLERELARRGAATPNQDPAGATATSAQAAAPPSPSQVAFATRFARGLWRELPASWRVGAVLGALALLASVALLLRGC